MTSKEMELFIIAIRYAKLLDDCNPEVGMGSTWHGQVAKKVTFSISSLDVKKAAEFAEFATL
jgi:hypothetical protein